MEKAIFCVIRAHTSPSAPTENFFQSTSAATRTRMGRKSTAAVGKDGAMPGGTVAAAAVQGASMALWAQAAVVAAGTRAVAGHYHRRRDASRSGSTRDRASCTRRSPCRAHWQTSVRRRSHRCTGSGCSRGASGRRTTGSPPSDTYRTPQSCRCLQCTRSPPRRRSKC